MSASAIDALCAAHGIATAYRDVWNQQHAPSDAAKRALLKAIGVDVDARADRARDARSARAVLVWREGMAPDPVRVPFAAPPSAGPFAWQIALESGGREDGACSAPHRDAAVDGDPAATVLESLDLPRSLPPGYHRLSIIDTAQRSVCATFDLIVCPQRCCPAAAGDARLFGPVIQLYALRSQRNWGIGDFTDLAALARIAARHGADFVGVNPLHALFIDRPAQASPYSPSTRLALNPLYIDVEAVADFGECAAARAHADAPSFRARLASLRDATLVDYAGVTAAKLEVLKLLFTHFERDHLAVMSPRAHAFRAFAAARPDGVGASAWFDALQATIMRADANAWGWPAWPAPYRDRRSPTTEDTARTLRRAIDFNLYLQWVADGQLAAATAAATDAGMTLGLYRDVAVGASRGGAETWTGADVFALEVGMGAPADAFNPRGQDWGLPPWIPERLADAGFMPWIALLRANMRHAGMLRLDHVMALMRLFWIPPGMSPAEGTYVDYPLDQLLALLALESLRSRCAVIGEDLGTVPDALRGALRECGVNSFRVVYFERDADGEFLPPGAYPAQALVAVSTHDLPTLHGYWQGADLRARAMLGLLDTQVLAQQRDDRSADRAHLARALARERLPAPAGDAPALAFEQVLAVHAYAARTRCALMSVQLEDVLGESEQVNLPGTTSEHYPNWRRKIPLDIDDFERDGRFAAVCAAIRAEGRGSARPGEG